MPDSYKIVASVGEDELRHLQKKDVKDVDVIEVRLDLFSRNYIQKEMKKRSKHWVFLFFSLTAVQKIVVFVPM